MDASKRRNRFFLFHDPTHIPGLASLTVHGVYSILPSLADSMKSTGPPGVPFTAYGASFPHGLARMRAVTLQETVPKQILPQMGLAELLESGEGLQVADVGCGLGLFSLALAARYPKTKVYGFDVDANSIELAKKNLEQAKEEGTVPREVSVEFQVRSLYKLDEFVTSDGGKPFDLVFAFDMWVSTERSEALDLRSKSLLHLLPLSRRLLASLADQDPRPRQPSPRCYRHP